MEFWNRPKSAIKARQRYKKQGWSQRRVPLETWGGPGEKRISVKGVSFPGLNLAHVEFNPVKPFLISWLWVLLKTDFIWFAFNRLPCGTFHMIYVNTVNYMKGIQSTVHTGFGNISQQVNCNDRSCVIKLCLLEGISANSVKHKLSLTFKAFACNVTHLYSWIFCHHGCLLIDLCVGPDSTQTNVFPYAKPSLSHLAEWSFMKSFWFPQTSGDFFIPWILIISYFNLHQPLFGLTWFPLAVYVLWPLTPSLLLSSG